MSYATPIQFTVTSPILLDEKIAEIQTKLDTLSWLTYSFARAYRFAKTVDGANVYYPAVYQGSSGGGLDYHNCLPNDNYTSHAFTYVKQPQRIVDATLGYEISQADISIIFVFRLDKISSKKSYYYTELLKYDVVALLDTIDSLKINETFDEMEAVFSDFTASAIEAKFLNKDFGALRFDCEVEYSNNCKITNSY